MPTTTIRAEHVGSMLRPAELLTARAEHRRGTLPAERLRELEDAAATAALKVQQDAGMQVFTDGEVRREDFMASVVETVGALVPAEESSARPHWHRAADDAGQGEVAPVTIGAPLYRRTPLSLTEARWLAGTAGPQPAARVRPDEPGQPAHRRRPAPQTGPRGRNGTPRVELTSPPR